MTTYTKNFAYSLLFVVTFLSAPTFVQAAYTYNGRTFDTFEEMQQYVIAYMEAWREVYGESSGKTTSAESKKKARIEIETSRATDIAHTSARLTGTFDLKRSKLVRIWFDYGYTPTSLGLRTETEVLDKNHGSKQFDRKVQLLLPNTKYYYRAGGINEDGYIAYGEVKSFKTFIDEQASTALIQVQTSGARDIDDNRATLQGRVSFKKEAIAYVWFEYGDDKDDLYRKTTKETAYKVNGTTVTRTIGRLDDEREYYYRIVGMDKNGEMSYGKVVTFKTRRNIVNEKPKVTTNRAQDIGVYSATLGGYVDMNDFRNGVAFLVYGEDRDEVASVAKDYHKYSHIRERGDSLQKALLDDDLDSYRSFSQTLSYLDINTRYYYAVGVEYENEDDDIGILMGSTQSFTTKSQ